jgi:SAM-dependent methyltransferase
MKNILRKIRFNLGLIGFDISKFINFTLGLGYYFRTYRVLKKQMKVNKDFVFGKFYPILDERSSESGTIRGHYFHQDLLIAQKIYQYNPGRHIDVGSRIDGFIAHIASFREVDVFDIRPLASSVKNIKFTQADLMQLPENMKSCCDSLSSLHAIEHFGLGRYGDKVDIDGHLKAITNLYYMLKPNGKLYFSVPIGKQRIEFNAHRIFSVGYLINILQGRFKIDSFCYVNDDGDLFENVLLNEERITNNFNCNYGCGIFELTKL